MNKAFIVIELLCYGLDGEDNLVGICPTLSLAEKLSQVVQNSWDLKDSDITQELFFNMWSEAGYPNENKIIPALVEKFPEYPVTEIERAVKYYFNSPFLKTEIKEITYFNNESEINDYGINSRRTFKR